MLYFPVPNPAAVAGDATRAEVGDLDGDLLLDVVVLVDHLMYVYFGPDLYQAMVAVNNGPVNDFTIVDNSGPGEVDMLYSVGIKGLDRCAYTVGAGFQSTNLIKSTWSSATTLRQGTIAGSTDVTLIALGADRRSLLSMRVTNSSHAQGPSSTLSEGIDHWTPIDWDGDGNHEIATATGAALSIYSLGNTEADHTHLAGGPVRSLTNIQRYHDPLERLMYVFDIPATTYQWLSLWGADATEVGFTVGPLNLTASTPATLPEYGTLVVLSHRFSWDLITFFNQSISGSAATFSNGPNGSALTNVYPWGVSAANNNSWVALGDLDGDDDIDGFMTTDYDDAVVLRDPIIDERDFRFWVGGDVIIFEDPNAIDPIELDIPYAQPAALDPDTDELEIVIWHQAHLNAPVNPLSVDRQYFPISGNWPLTVTLTFPDQTSTPFQDVYTITARAVKRDANDNLLEAKPGSVLQFTSDNMIFDELVNAYQDTLEEIASEIFPNPPPAAAAGRTNGSVLSGGLIPGPNLNPFCPGDPPDPTGTINQ
jgi:hypothetical protein